MQLAKLVGEVVSVEKVPITFDVHGGSGTIRIGDAGISTAAPAQLTIAGTAMLPVPRMTLASALSSQTSRLPAKPTFE